MSEYEILAKYQSLPEELKKKVIQFMDSLHKTSTASPKKRKAGLAKGKIKINAGFDDPLEDFEEYS